jgi:hypothetical protein
VVLPGSTVVSAARGRAASRVALCLGAFVAVLLAGAVPLAIVAHGFDAGLVSFLLVFVPFVGVGVVLALRLPRNPIGWIFLFLALGVLLSVDAGAYALRAYRIDHRGLPLSRLAVVLATGWISFVLLPIPILLFPDGRVAGRAWRWTLRLYLVVGAMFAVAIGAHDLHAFTDRTFKVDSSGELAGRSGHVESIVAGLGLAVMAVVTLSWVARLLFRYRRSAGDERQQYKWLFAGAATCLIGFLVSIPLNSVHSEPWHALAQAAPFAIVALPLGIGVAILRYRLYDLDRLISRTISYAILTGLLAGIFIGLVVLATDVLPFSSPVAVAASTLAAAALFNPLRLRIQRVVDRRFNRSRYDAEAVVSAFGSRLRDSVDLETVRRELENAVARTVEPTHVSLWLRGGS